MASASAVDELLCRKEVLALEEREAEAWEWSATLQRVLRNVVQRGRLWIGGTPYVFVEIEAYHHGGKHTDTFTHCGKFQDVPRSWYFHRHGKGYKGGTYKGLDVTFGTGTSFSGLLVRCIAPESDPTAVIEGSCCVVDHMLKVLRCGSVASLAASFPDDVPSIVKPTSTSDTSSPMYITVRSPDHALSTTPVFLTSRVGLSLKRCRGDDEPFGWYLTSPYRASRTATMKKGRIYLVTSLHRAGMSTARIHSVTGISEKTIKRYCGDFDAGLKRSPSSFYGRALNSRDTCMALGACSKVLMDGHASLASREPEDSGEGKREEGEVAAEEEVKPSRKRQRQTTFAEVWKTQKKKMTRKRQEQ